MKIKLRKAKISDCKLLYEWANDTVVRNMALSSDRIDWEEHKSWFRKKIIDSNSQIYIAMIENEPIGQIRFDVINALSAEVDVHIKTTARGKGFGTQIISLGCNCFLANSSVNTIYAVIKSENTESLYAFEKAGFTEFQRKSIKQQKCIQMIKKST